ncbi:ataxin-2 homolog isoform X1 [Glycine max]|uniref:ataxin-2 homolog isoform X1 n=2 Tax=Glycine max TaxID=3847 RepID=UPI000719155A|nr:ataxin-2 homolog isoform X1 [Glycine max]|eukprot:XP_014626343.1 ataxin-2 homolog isoform X1 [Glycine max]
MGCRNRDSITENHTSSSSSSSDSLSEALLFTTMCIVGHPVDVHVKDGSVYSGIFHTASVHADYGIVLKKARMTKKGKGNNNVGNEGFVDTLVILSSDLVQVVAKGVMLHADVVGGNITGGDEEAVAHNVCSESLTCEVENHTGPLMDTKQVNHSRYYDIFYFGGQHLRQAGDDKSNSNGKTDNCGEKSEFVNEKTDEKIQSLNSSHETDTSLGQEVAVEHGSTDRTSIPSDNGLLCNNTPASVKASDRNSERSTSADSVSTNLTQGVDLIQDSQPARSNEISVPRGTGSTRNAKEFKLNPAAKTFSPSFVNPMPATSAANMVYIPNSSPPVPVTIQPEVGFNTFASRPSMPVKVSQYSNLTVGNGGSGSQFSQPIVGHVAHRAQPLRYATHYNPVLSEPAYMQPSSPAVMVGRSPQLVYVQPVSHDLIHGTTAVPPVSARPLMNHVQFPKQQGGTIGPAMPVCVPPPVLTSGHQPFTLRSHIPLLQPGFPVSRPISVPGPNGFYGTKF